MFSPNPFKAGDKVKFKPGVENLLEGKFDGIISVEILNTIKRLLKEGTVFTVHSVHHSPYTGYGKEIDNAIPIFIMCKESDNYWGKTTHIPHTFIEFTRHSNPIKRHSNMRDMYGKSSGRE